MNGEIGKWSGKQASSRPSSMRVEGGEGSSTAVVGGGGGGRGGQKRGGGGDPLALDKNTHQDSHRQPQNCNGPGGSLKKRELEGRGPKVWSRS